MPVIVDSSVWSLALRRNAPPDAALVAQLERLIRAQHVVMLGCIRQELLSGIRHVGQFDLLKQQLAAFPDLPVVQTHYETAAQMFNQCRSVGIQGSNTDFLICAVAKLYNMSIFTTDKDFMHYRDILGIELLES